MRRLSSAIFATSCAAGAAAAEPAAVYGPELEGFDYPFTVQRFNFPSQGQSLSMAFMDIAPDTPNSRTVVLLHGKNFCAATWEATIKALTGAGYRVVALDQIGFCKSTKPERYQYSFQQLAHNTHALLASRGIARATIMGHSMGLEDWKAECLPYATVATTYQAQLKTSFDSIKADQLRSYYHGQWKPEYDRWVAMLSGMYAGAGKERVAWNQALTSDMIYTQPVVYELGLIKSKTLLMIGGKDRTAPGANRAPAEIAARLGNYPELGRRAARTIPDATLVEFPELGHSPQVEAPEAFHKALLDGLSGSGAPK